MATLTGQSIASSYEQLLHVDTDGGGNTTTLVPIKDGDNGTTFAAQLSTTTICIDNPTTSSSSQGGILRLQSDDGAALGDTHRLGVIEFGAAEDGSNTITTGARIEAIADAAWSASENGADMVFYTTDGNASQSEVMRLTADNLVGIGTTSPGAMKDTASTASLQIGDGSGNVYVSVKAGTNNEANISFEDDAIQTRLGIFGTVSDIFGIYDDTADAFRMAIDTSGNIGIGTASPSAPLDIKADVVDFIHFDRTANAGVATTYKISVGAADEMGIGRDGEEDLFISAAGNVGIGIAAPSSKLTISDNSAYSHFGSGNSDTAEPWLGSFNHADVASATYGWGFFNRATDGDLYLLRYNNSTTGTVQMAFDRSSGNVGIGRTPTEKLDVYLASGEVHLQVESGSSNAKLILEGSRTAANDCGSLYFKNDGALNSIVQAQTTDATGDGAHLLFYTSEAGSGSGITERVRIQDDGNVGIGTDSPEYILEVEHSNTTAVANNLGQGINIHNTGGLNAISALTFTGGDHHGDGCLTGIYAKHVNVTENSEESELHFVTTTSETLVEAMTILGSGNVGINDSDPSEGKLSVVLPDSANHKAVYIRNQDSTNDPVTLYLHNESGVAGNYIECFLGGTGTTMYIQSDGDGYNTNGTWGTISDERLKENITDATSKLDEVNQLQVRNFNFIDDDLKQIGFVAQEIEKVFPSLVTEDKGIEKIEAKEALYETVVVQEAVEEELWAEGDDLPEGIEAGDVKTEAQEEETEEQLVSEAVEAIEGREPMKRVKSSILIPILVKAVQELSAKVEALENA